MGYRGIRMCPALDRAAASATLRGPPAVGAAPPATADSLLRTCCGVLRRTLHPAMACTVLDVAEYLGPEVVSLRQEAVEYVAGHLEAVVDADCEGFCNLRASSLEDVLRSLALVSRVLGPGGSAGAAGREPPRRSAPGGLC